MKNHTLFNKKPKVQLNPKEKLRYNINVTT